MELQLLPFPRNVTGTAVTATAGRPLSPEDRLRTMSPDEWEDVTLEFADALANEHGYVKILGLGGRGDKGRDVAALCSERFEPGEWDNYQCKHYCAPLAPSDIYIELGKLCFYTFRRDYPIPRKYYFVSPNGIGPALSDLIHINHDTIAAKLLEEWDRHCSTLGSMSESLADYIQHFNFSILAVISPLDFIKVLLNSRWGIARFGGGLPLRVPPSHPAPIDFHQESEIRYML